jgi:hypothetical protein
MKSLKKTLFLFALILTSSSVFSQKFSPIEEIPEGKALVYIYRPGSMVGAALHWTVKANDEKVSEYHLRNKTYLAYFAEPGRYTFWGHVTNVRREADLDVEAGKTYYIHSDCCAFTIPDLEDAEKEIVKCKLSNK